LRARTSTAPLRPAEFERVVDQVPHHLLQPLPVAVDDERLVGAHELDAHLLVTGSGAQRLGRLAHHLTQIDGRALDGEAAVDDARDVEQLVDELALRVAAPADRLQRAHLGRRVEPPRLQQLHPADDRGQRRAQLVRDHRQEVILGLARQLGRLARRQLLGGEAIFLAQPRRLLLEQLAALIQLDEERDLGAQEVGIERLGDVVDRAQIVTARHELALVVKSGDEDDRQRLVARMATNHGDGLEPIEHGHLHVHERHRELLGLRQRQRLRARTRAHHTLPERLQRSFQREEVGAQIVGDEDARGHGVRA
jgi:hypothetical protein